MSNDQSIIKMPNKEYNKSSKTSKGKAKKSKKSSKKSGGSASGPFGFLTATNDWLEELPQRINEAYANFIGTGEQVSQDQVDVICEWLAWKVNIAVERKRQTILKALYGQYDDTVLGKVMKAANVVKSFVSDPLGTLGSFAGLIFGPVGPIIAWGTQLISEVMRLASNLAKISSALPPSPPSPSISYRKFKLRIGSISMGQIASDPNSLPAPEVLFPEPQKPFTRESFAKSFETASANLKSNKKVYMLSEEDKKALSDFDNRVDSDFGIA